MIYAIILLLQEKGRPRFRLEWVALNMDIVRNAILQGKWFMSHHARVRAGQRRISDTDVIVALLQGQILEDYSEDPRGNSCLVLGYTSDKRAIHIVCAQDLGGSLIIITVYQPEPPAWVDEKTRKEGE